MTIQPFPGFNSLETHHCVTGSMLQIFRFHNIDISEDMLLGLGSGVGLTYWHQKGIDPFIGGRANVGRPGEEGLEKTTCLRLGVILDSFYTSSARKAEKSLLEFLEGGLPVMLQVDMGYLPYFDFGGEEYHFGYHVIVIAGYDPDSHQVLVADRDLGFHTITWDDLANARGSTYKPFPPRNRWYEYNFNGYHPPTADDVRTSIKDVVTGMLEPPISNFGVKGIRKAAKRILKWPQVLDPESLRRTCFNTFVFIDAMGGTGGGIFRYMYGRFLKEAADILGDSRLQEIGDQFKSIGDRWQSVASIFRLAFELENPASLLPETTDPLLAIAAEEEGAWSDLRDIFERTRGQFKRSPDGEFLSHPSLSF